MVVMGEGYDGRDDKGIGSLGCGMVFPVPVQR